MGATMAADLDLRAAARATTLAQARIAVEGQAPPPDSNVETRRAYYLWAATVYDRVAKLDHDHEHETRAYAQCARNAAERCT